MARGEGGHADHDGDGVGDVCDTCPGASNPGQIVDGLMQEDDPDRDFIGVDCEQDADCSDRSNPRQPRARPGGRRGRPRPRRWAPAPTSSSSPEGGAVLCWGNGSLGDRNVFDSARPPQVVEGDDF